MDPITKLRTKVDLAGMDRIRDEIDLQRERLRDYRNDGLDSRDLLLPDDDYAEWRQDDDRQRARDIKLALKGL